MVSLKLSLAIACLLATVNARPKISAFKQYGKGDLNAGTQNPVIGIVSQTLEAEMKNDTRF